MKGKTPEDAKKLFERLTSKDYDGVVLHFPNGLKEIVVFSPTKITSATSNTGQFSSNSTDIRYSKSTSPKRKRRVKRVKTHGDLYDGVHSYPCAWQGLVKHQVYPLDRSYRPYHHQP